QHWAAEHLELLKNAPPVAFHSFSSAFKARQEDCLEPLFHIAGFLGEEWPLKLDAALCGIFHEHNSEDEHAYCIQVLADIRDLFASSSCERLSTDEILDGLNTQDDRPWCQWNNGRPMTARTLARLLRR